MSSVLKTGLAVAEAAPPAKTSSIAVAEQVPREAVPTSTASPSVQEDFEVIEVSGQRRSEADRLKVSAEAVSVVELDDELRQVSGLADVLARSEGIVVQQGGGLGSRVRLSLNGLTDDQIPVFLDGLPLAVQGFGNLSLVPVNLIQRVEIYSGVVPVRFGADALGGAINLVSRSPGVGFGGSASYEVGSFMRQVATGALHYRDDERGWWVAGSGFYASAENDYTIDVLLADRRGNSFDAEARLFNNAFEQGGGTLEVGLTDRVRAKLLSLRFFANTVDREIQSDFIQSAPFAEVDFTQLDLGGLLRYRVDLVDQLELSVVAGFTRTERNLIDLGGRRVSWLGTCLFDVPEGGELNGSTEDVDFIDDGAYARAQLEWQPYFDHTFRLAAAADLLSRSEPGVVDPAQRDQVEVATGLEYQTSLFGGFVENIVFGKHYFQELSAEDTLTGGVLVRRDPTTNDAGVGDELRLNIIDERVAVELSYEYALRLPTAVEIFGDGLLISSSLQLAPERSHNLNVGLELSFPTDVCGEFVFGGTGFARLTENLIALLGTNSPAFENVNDAQTLGVVATAEWPSPGDVFRVDGNTTYFRQENTSSEGAFGMFEGDRIPNRPFFLANLAAHLELPELLLKGDRVRLDW